MGPDSRNAMIRILCRQSGQQSGSTSVFGSIYDSARAVGRFFRRDIDHALLGETGPDDVLGKVAESGFVSGPNPAADVNVEAGVAPRKHVFHYGVIYFRGRSGRNESGRSRNADLRSQDTDRSRRLQIVPERLFLTFS